MDGKEKCLVSTKASTENFPGGGGATEKRLKNSNLKRPKNSTFKPLSTIFVPCLKIQGGGGKRPLPPLPTP